MMCGIGQGVILVLWLAVFPVAARGNQPPADGKALAAELLRYLGLGPGQRAELEAGSVVHNGLAGREERPDEIAAAGAMLIVKAPEPEAVIAAFLDAQTFLRVHEVRRYQALQGGNAELAAFRTMPLPENERLRDLVETPARYLHLSKSEAATLERIKPSAPDLAEQVRTTLAEILARRVTDYARDGIRGIQPYVRENGNIVNPAADLHTAILSVGFLNGVFPGFLDVVGAPAAGTGPQLRRDYYWMERPVEGETVIVLSAESRQRNSHTAIGADVNFYASREYNAMLTVVGVVPYNADWMVFALNHTFTDQVTGFGSSVKRRVGRDMVAAHLAKQLTETRQRLSPDQP